ncbi:Nicotinate phosphoribosyltransferase [Thermodesulfobium narugense DSM 14796]|uniref:Nicotinate phosphoribosyltransferase n=1 Tax=Thermodesulfobium narugense DSM 14796 TaxID=747365 RepID=M1E5J5_9BACT|nr:nicotinate phosphoribosyltransferase [Thermodesulfobium narugense]AEE15137.1 Nicotinate phosphoribosyltransferase [Thermodesulfobium narugense DSM 14796]
MLISNFDDIIDGLTADSYFLRTFRILKEKGVNKKVVAEIKASSFPPGYNWAIFAGINEARLILNELKDIEVLSLKEGSIFYPDEPVLTIKGNYLDFAIFETALLGILCQASAVATKAARIKKIIGSKELISFGSRRAHPSITAHLERNAYIGGCDGVSSIIGAKVINQTPRGTMPHSLILLIGSLKEALKAFDDVIEKDIPRIALIDTFCDEKFEAIEAARLLGERLYAVRLDTPSSRRGNVRKIVEEVRWELDIRGFEKVKIVLSGGIDEYIAKDLCDVVDIFGVGTALTNAPIINFSMDIVEIEEEPIAKRGKKSGQKDLIYCPVCDKRFVVFKEKNPEFICPACKSKATSLLVPIEEPYPDDATIRKRTLENISKIDSVF